jgi:hypothetical protein
MTRVNLQFHADPSELINMLSNWIEDLDLYVAAETFGPPYRAIPIDRGDARGELSRLAALDRVSISRAPLQTTISKAFDFHEQNPDCLVASFGKRSSTSLRESALGGSTENLETLALWRKIRRLADTSMHHGSIVVNPLTGARAEVRRHPFSDGALELYRRGVVMLAAAGSVEYQFVSA